MVVLFPQNWVLLRNRPSAQMSLPSSLRPKGIGCWAGEGEGFWVPRNLTLDAKVGPFRLFRVSPSPPPTTLFQHSGHCIPHYIKWRNWGETGASCGEKLVQTHVPKSGLGNPWKFEYGTNICSISLARARFWVAIRMPPPPQGKITTSLWGGWKIPLVSPNIATGGGKKEEEGEETIIFLNPWMICAQSEPRASGLIKITH